VVQVPLSPPEETERGRGRQRARVGREREDAGGWGYSAAVRREIPHDCACGWLESQNLDADATSARGATGPF
jgi:hypothetical protein